LCGRTAEPGAVIAHSRLAGAYGRRGTL